MRGAAALALRLGISPLAVGLTVVAFGTSSPELVVSVDAALSGRNDIAVANVVGSNISNLALVLGLAALVRPARVEAKIVRFDAPLLIGVSLVFVVMLLDGGISRLEGSLLLCGLAAYTVFTFWEARRETPQVQAEFASSAPSAIPPVVFDMVLIALGLAALVAGGHLLVEAAVAIAGAFGVSEAVIGLTVVAVGTSFPELATSVVAAARGQGDISVGNLVGSNLFNLLCILGLASAVKPLARGGLEWTDLGVMVACALALIPLLAGRHTLGRTQGALLLAGYVAYLVSLGMR